MYSIENKIEESRAFQLKLEMQSQTVQFKYNREKNVNDLINNRDNSTMEHNADVLGLNVLQRMELSGWQNSLSSKKESKILQLVRNKRREQFKQERKKTSSRLNKPTWATPGTDVSTKRVASGGGMVAESGTAKAPAISDRTQGAWNQMLAKYGVHQIETWTIDNCAEAHLWQLLVERGISPKRVEVVVGKYSAKGKIKGDRPCRNCSQWIYHEFGKVSMAK